MCVIVLELFLGPCGCYSFLSFFFFFSQEIELAGIKILNHTAVTEGERAQNTIIAEPYQVFFIYLSSFLFVFFFTLQMHSK